MGTPPCLINMEVYPFTYTSQSALGSLRLLTFLSAEPATFRFLFTARGLVGELFCIRLYAATWEGTGMGADDGGELSPVATWRVTGRLGFN